MDIKARMARMALEKRIATETERTPELMAEALAALQADTSQVAARQLAKAMGEGWGDVLLPVATEMLAHKKGSERLKALELFAAIAHADTIAQLEAAKSTDRSKKLHSQYDYAIRRIDRTCKERARVNVDPTDRSVDPVARLVELANMDSKQFEAMDGIHGMWNVSYALDWADLDGAGQQPFTVEEETWAFVFTGDRLVVQKPNGKQSKSVPKACGEAPKETFKALKKRIREAQKKRHARLEESLVTGVGWPGWLWRLLYVDHPLADASTETVVFEVLQGKSWTPFCVTPEKGFVDGQLESLEIADGDTVRVAHPADWSGDVLETWQRMAADGEWNPPFQQLFVVVSEAVADRAIADVVESLEAPFTMTLAARLEKLGFERYDVHDGGVVAERYRTLGGGYFLFLVHGPMPVRRSWIDRDAKTELRRAWFTLKGEKVGATAVPRRVYSEGVRLLRALVGG